MTTLEQDRQPFETLDPEGVAEWKKCYERVLEVAAAKEEEGGDGIIRYEEIANILGRELNEGNQRLCAPMQRVKIEVQKEHQFALIVVPNVGYRIIEPSEHFGLARHHQRKSRRQVSKAQLALLSADRARLTDDERRRQDHLANRLSILEKEENKTSRVDWGSD